MDNQVLLDSSKAVARARSSFLEFASFREVNTGVRFHIMKGLNRLLADSA